MLNLTRGNKVFELTNHLGNVLATVSDRKWGRDVNSDGTIDYYVADSLSATDYYPFGMIMPGRDWSAGSYRYGFNGKERDPEAKDLAGTQLDYGMRIYDPRAGRFLSVDPLTKSYPWYTPYQFAGNKPIAYIDVDGLEENSSSTYVYRPPLLSRKPIYAGLVTVTDATSQKAHQTFSGTYSRLKDADRTGMATSLVTGIIGSNIGNSSSRLDITMTGTRSEVTKTWKGTDIKYFTQYSYSFVNNNAVEKGTIEMQTGQIQASSRVWDPLAFLVLNRVISSVVINIARIAGPSATEEMITLYRSISKAEMESIQKSQRTAVAQSSRFQGSNSWKWRSTSNIIFTTNQSHKT